jgi:hypothetical protein
MLYIKPYKLFESSQLNHNEIREDVIDILLPLSDDGLAIETYFMFHKRLDGVGKLKIFITHSDNKGFNLTPYVYELNHLNSYLEANGWVLESDPSVSDRNYGFDKWMGDLDKSQNYMAVPMFYTKRKK